MEPINPKTIPNNASTATFKTVRLNDGQTLSLTSKWLFVKDVMGKEVMRLAPSQSNMRVVAQGCQPAAKAIGFFCGAALSLVLTILCLVGMLTDASAGASAGICMFIFLLMTVLCAWAGRIAWKRRHDRVVFLTTDNQLFYHVRVEDLPDLFELMEMIENWDGSNKS